MGLKISAVIAHSGGNVKRCYESVKKQDCIFEIILLSDKELTFNIDESTVFVKVDGVDFEQMVDVVSNHVHGDRILFIQSNDYLVASDALEKNLQSMQDTKSEVMISNSVVLNDSQFSYRYLPSGRFHTINTNNIIPYMRCFDTLRRIYGIIFSREVFDEIIRNEVIKSEQNLIYYFAHYAKNMIIAQNHFYCWVNDGTHPVEQFIWSDNYEYSFAHRVDEKLHPESYNAIISKEINIAFCLDDNLVKFLDTLIYSIEKNHHYCVNVYIVYRRLKESNIAFIRRLSGKLQRVNIHLRQAPKELYQMQQAISLESTRLPIDTYLKVLLPEVLQEVDRIIYLDTDVLVNRDLTDFWNIPLNGNFVAASLDSRSVKETRVRDHTLFGMQGNHYFNSGSMLMDLKLMRKYRTAFHITNLAIDTSHLFEQADQDAFNLFLINAVEIVDIKYNFLVYFQSYIPCDPELLSIIHFASPDKAWRNIEINNMPKERRELVHLYRHYRNEAKNYFGECPFKISILLDVRNCKYHQFEKTIDSFLSQDYTNIELLIQVDQSFPRKWLAYIQAIEKYYPNMIFVLNEDIRSIIEKSTGQFIYFMEVDNFLFDDFAFSKMIQYFDSNQFIMYTPHHKMNNDTKIMYINSNSKEYYFVDQNNRKKYFQDLNGILVKREYLDSVVSSSDEDDLLSKINEDTTPIQLYDESLWMRVFN